MLGAVLLATLALLSEVPDSAVPAPRPQSIGHPYSGHLKNPVPFPATSEWHTTQGSTRAGRVYYSTDYLNHFLLGAAEAVGRSHPGSFSLSVGNLSLEHGGDITMSRSHNTGRDVDLAYYVETLDGTPAPSYYHAFGKDGHSVQAPKRFRLDLARNWAVFRAMLDSKEAELQYFIVAPYIERMLLEYAKSIGEDPEIIRRAELIMMLPSWAKMHDNHIHVRVMCTPADWRLQCKNGGAVWPWATAMYNTLVEATRDLLPRLRDADPAVRRAALAEVASRGLDPAVDAVAGLLADADEGVREAAVDTLVAITNEATTGPVLQAALTASPKVAARLLAAALPVAGAEAVGTAEAVLAGQHPAVDSSVSGKDKRKVQSAAARVLKQQPISNPTHPGGP